DVVLLDLTIPGAMGGKEAIQHLRSLDPQVKAIVTSGYSDDPIMSDYQRYGFHSILVKPYRIMDLAKLLESVCAPMKT
nr:response regulator [Nitrospirales bacterium]